MSNIIRTELPLPSELMVNFFTDKSQIFEIDYLKTKENLAPKSMLIYLANLKIDCDFDIIDEELMQTFFTLKETTNITNLQYVYANILFYAKTGEILYQHAIPTFSISEFIENNKDVVYHHVNVLNSIPLFLSYCYDLPEQGDTISEPDINHLNMDNKMHPEFGFAFLGLFQMEDFIMAWMEDTLPLNEQTYYVQYFTEFMFGGKNLFYYFSHPNNTYFGLATMLSNFANNTEGANEHMHQFVDALHKTLPVQQLTLLQKIKNFFMSN